MRNLRLGKYRGYYAAVWHDGNTRRSSLGTTDYQEALTAFEEFKQQIRKAERSQAPKLDEIMKVYAEDRESLGKDAERIRNAWKAMKPHFGHMLVHHVDKATCRTYTKVRKELGRSASTIHTELGYLRSGVKWAENDGWIERAPYVELPQRSPARDRWLTKKEADELINAATAPHLRLFIIIALTTAARTEAILELPWSRVDFTNKRIDLNPVVGIAAVNKGRARVPINNKLMAALTIAEEGALSDYVVEYAGGPMKSVKKGFKAAATRAGLVGVSPHTLRHTAATWMAQQGVPMERIAGYLGHKDSRTTERVYAHHHPDYLRDASEALDW